MTQQAKTATTGENDARTGENDATTDEKYATTGENGDHISQKRCHNRRKR